MAVYTGEFFSQALAGQNDFMIVLPNDVPPMMADVNPNYARPMKTLVLLHGYNGGLQDWITGSDIRNLSQKYNVAVIMPNGRNSFYVDREATGEKWATYVGSDLLNYCRKTFGLSLRKEDTFIGGFSMGGYGAFHVGLQFPENFSKIIALSSALVVNHMADMKEGNPMANLAYYRMIFGDLEKAAASLNNPEVQIRNLKAEGKELPDVFMACGSEDFLIEANRAMDKFLTEEGVAHEFKVSPGQHNWTFWNEYMEPGLQYALGE